MFEVIMGNTISGEETVFDSFQTREEAETFVKNSKQSDQEAEKAKWFLYAIEEVKITEENIDDYLEKWHNSSSDLEVHEYLGLTIEQYARWVETSKLEK